MKRAVPYPKRSVIAVFALAIGCILIPFSADAASVRSSEAESANTLQRQQLNARISEMLRSGEGARLRESAPPSRSTQTRPSERVRGRATAPRTEGSITSRAETSAASGDGTWVLGGTGTSVSSLTNGASPRRSATRAFYTPPRLDLVTPVIVPTDPIRCLTEAIYYEARNESEEGQRAVAEVVMNRMRSGLFPASVCEVVYQRNSRTCQFTFTCDGAIGRSAIDLSKWARAEGIAKSVHAALSNVVLPASSLNYHANYVSPGWARRLERVRQIGAHIFYGNSLSGQQEQAAPLLQPAAQSPPSGLTFVRNEGFDRIYDSLRASAPQATGQ